ncbi:MAG: bifunctional metallophosphatase/5'-nucleotidase [Ignavibacteria bacterium]|nr:bifunctional metallophosphatase/5'-nucleotidase [Ignavibacteria bacterium]
MKIRNIFLLAVFHFICLPVFSQDSGGKELRILHWNDLHARNQMQKGAKKDSVTGERTEYIYGGTSNMLGYINKYRDDKSLVLNAGDDYQGTPISTLTRGNSQIELLNLFGLDAFVLGNHEFDYGQFTLDSGLSNAKFDYLSANVYLKPMKKTMGKPFTVKNINGIKTGIIGITAPDLLTLTLPSNMTEIKMLDVDSVVTSAIESLKKEECDLIILLTHVGVDYDKELASKFHKDVDVIIGGHSHTPLFKPVIQDGVIIAQAGSYSRWLGKLELKIDTEKDTVLSYQGELIETVLDSAVYDRSAQAEVDRMLETIGPELKKVIGRLEVDWTRSFSSESNLGQWEADAIRKKLNTDIAFMNAGGLRKDLLKGDITVGDVWEINPFGNTIVTFSVKGSTLKQMMRNMLGNYLKELKESGGSDMMVASGIGVEYDSRKAYAGESDFIVSVKVGGAEAEDEKMYSIATNNYVGTQFKKYFGTVDEDFIIKDSNIIDRDLIIEAVKEQKVISQPLEGRIVDITGEVK